MSVQALWQQTGRNQVSIVLTLPRWSTVQTAFPITAGLSVALSAVGPGLVRQPLVLASLLSYWSRPWSSTPFVSASSTARLSRSAFYAVCPGIILWTSFVMAFSAVRPGLSPMAATVNDPLTTVSKHLHIFGELRIPLGCGQQGYAQRGGPSWIRDYWSEGGLSPMNAQEGGHLVTSHEWGVSPCESERVFP